jgi:hypothetical protein
MSESIGEQLIKLNRGDSVAVLVEDTQYDGEVDEIKRWRCELNQGFMESGEISIRIELDAETLSRHELSSEYISITATENVPQSWDVPQVSVYEPIENEIVTDLGTVTEVEIRTSRQ